MSTTTWIIIGVAVVVIAAIVIYFATRSSGQQTSRSGAPGVRRNNAGRVSDTAQQSSPRKSAGRGRSHPAGTEAHPSAHQRDRTNHNPDTDPRQDSSRSE